MKKAVCVYLAVFAAVLTLVGVESAKAEPTQQLKPLVLRVAHQTPPTGTMQESLIKACSEVEKLTEGRLKFEFYWSESLVKAKDFAKAIQKGICDISFVTGSYHPAEIPLWTHNHAILYHPKGEDAAWLARKLWQLYDNSPGLRADFEKIGQTGWFGWPLISYALFSHKIVETIQDMAGKRLRITGEGPSKMLSAIGAHPTFMTAADTYTALERKVVDGGFANFEMGVKYSWYEVAPNVIDTKITIGYGFINVSKSALNKMSEKDKKTFMDVGRRVSIELGQAINDSMQNYKTLMIKKGAKLLPFPEDERVKWAEKPAVKALIKNWIEEHNSAGRPGTEVMRTFLNTLEVPQWMPPGY